MSTCPNTANNGDLPYWAALSTFSKFGPKRFNLLSRYFPDMRTAWEASAGELLAAGINERAANEFIAHRQNTDPGELMERLDKEKINILILTDGRYPKLLKEIFDAPPVLYYRGELPDNLNFCLAVVGSRKYTSYGQQTAQSLVSQLAQAGLVIVSGLAIGIDALAHSACLQANGKTIAVLGAGLDRQNIYPATNRYLAEKILARGGLLLSEYAPGTPPLEFHFPQRNRIISGISLGTLVIEAAVSSGALITAQSALEQNREVFAVPGSVFNPNSAGTNNLIKTGAKAVTCASEIIETLSLENIASFVQNQKAIPATPAEQRLISVLNHEPTHINALTRLAKLDTASINATLLTMELKGYVRNLGGGNYVLA
ncbi:DNA-protecting protein DprA [Candidatus Falkowbacteria bacterium CG10_big_fil_rev_8_21_14_0_10_43_11]|uniref:DNA-protecting protein DprA n=1 Tax=Candidatus Falkowbacteria bacterium CG10_big_fil_rev_8_21_14_0_10_43_11 TaxID=1974568 RepID=A0A2M6WMV9_9BACT|nr:MAG: DNA-protecting protein DprA [Candidatus Falkowbacteria bacterium CG10_big_fil_rev_8_21_14_0_10_43_11]